MNVNHRQYVGGQDFTRPSKEPAKLGAVRISDLVFDKPLTNNELIESGLKGMQEGEFGSYRVIDFSCSTFDNPIQMICRHKHSGRLKIANIDRNGSVGWDNDTIPWN